eukprot:162074_1
MSVPILKTRKRTQKQSKRKAFLNNIVNNSGVINIKINNNDKHPSYLRNIIDKVVNNSGVINIDVHTNSNTDPQELKCNRINNCNIGTVTCTGGNANMIIGCTNVTQNNCDQCDAFGSCDPDSDHSDISYHAKTANDLAAMRKRVADIEAEAAKISAMSCLDDEEEAVMKLNEPSNIPEQK